MSNVISSAAPKLGDILLNITVCILSVSSLLYTAHETTALFNPESLLNETVALFSAIPAYAKLVC